MGSTASSSAVKKKPVKSKKTSAKKKSVRKSASKKTRSRATPVKKKARAGKQAATSSKPVRKKVAAKKQAPRKKAAPKPATAPAKQADVAAAPGQDDSKSLAWMAAQAASALKAVKANQNERAQVLLAKSEITPAKPAKPLKDTTIPKPARAETDQATAGIVTTSRPVNAGTTGQKKTRPSHTAATPLRNTEKQAVKKSPADKPASETSETAAKKIRSVQPTPASNEPAEVKIATITATTASGETKVPDETHQAELPPAVAIAATTTDNRRTRRPLLFTGIIVLLGILVARAWLNDDSTTDIQPRVATEQAAPAMTTPSVTAIASDSPAARPVTVKPQAENWTPTARPAWQARGVQPAPLVPARNPAVPQSGYTPAYGYYYPPQPLRQQHDYWPAYTRPSYSH